MYLLRSLFVLSLVSLALALPISTDKSTAYYPCPADIVFAIDASNDALTPKQFNSQMDLLKNIIVTSSWNNFERIGLAWYNKIVSTHYGLGTMNSKREFDLYTGNAKLSNGTDFTLLLKDLVQTRSSSDVFPLNTFIFISSSSKTDIQNSIQYAQQLQSYSSLNLIILGNSLSAFNVAALNPDSVISWNFGIITDELKNFVVTNLKCGSGYSTNSPTKAPATTLNPITLAPATVKTQSPVTSSDTSPTKSIPQVGTNCNALVAIAIDGSSDIFDDAHFKSQLAFIKDPLTSDYNGAPWHDNYQNIALIAYAGIVINMNTFGVFDSKESVDNWVDNIPQISGMSLSGMLPQMEEFIFDTPLKINSIVFISKTLGDDIKQSHDDAATLLSRGSLIFVAMGDAVDINLLKTLPHTAVISWPDMSKYDPELLRQEILGNLACSQN